MTAFQQKLAKDNPFVRVVVGTSDGSPAWWCVQVDKLAWELYKKELSAPFIDLDQYGKILKKGWGKWPSETVIAELEKNYGVKLKKPH